MKRLAVIPSDPIRSYLQQGYLEQWLKDYYNPRRYFDEVYLLSNLEQDQEDLLGMKVIHTKSNNFAKQLKKLNIDIVRAYGGNWACAQACEHKLTGVPVVVSVHDTSQNRLYDSIKHADVVLCVSQAVKDLVVTKFKNKDRTWILPNRVDFQTMRPYSKEETKDLDVKFPYRHKILHVGRRSEEKNLDTLIKALPLLGDDYCVIAIGYGDSLRYKRIAQEYKVLNRVFFIDAVAQQELARYYSWCTCMCTPSRREGFGMVFIEAMACGAVVITSDIAPLNEYLVHEENGLLIKDIESPSVIAHMVRQGCTEEVLRNKIQGQARASVQIFEKQTIEQQEVEIYQKVLDMKNQGLFGRSSHSRSHLKQKFQINEGYQKALMWIKAHTITEQGIIVSTKEQVPYLEVTGYLIPTLIQAKEWGLARSYVEFLSYMQKPNGSFCGPDGQAYVFDSGQALRGLVAASLHWPEFKSKAIKTADYIVSQMEPNGRIDCNYKDVIPEYVQVFVLPALLEAGRMFERDDYVQAARKSVGFYKAQNNVLSPKYLTHFLAYILDGFIDMGEVEFVRPFVEEIFILQCKDGSIRGQDGVKWVCSVGLMQLAIVAYKLGMHSAADKAMGYVCSKQNLSGGFYGSYGLKSTYFPKAEISWANKFFMDAVHLKLQHQENLGVEQMQGLNRPLLNEQQWHTAITAGQTVETLVKKLKSNVFPVWSKPLLRHTDPDDVVLELGSGTGELAAICAMYDRQMHMMDYSKESNIFAQQLFQDLGLRGEFHCHDILQAIPLNSGQVDWVYSSGVLEHFSDDQIVGILKESKRIARKGVMALVPNANALFYRIGKNKMENEGKWAYGHEDPKWSMRSLFEAAGLNNIQEYSIGTYHALEFWGKANEDIKKFFDQCSSQSLQQLNQGYLLFTIGYIS